MLVLVLFGITGVREVFLMKALSTGAFDLLIGGGVVGEKMFKRGVSGEAF